MKQEQREIIRGIPKITALLASINILVFLYVEWFGSSQDAEYMIQMGAMYEPAFVDNHEYYRLITHFFLHFGFEHLFNNMISLFALGYVLEEGLGSVKMLIIYMLSGALAGIVSLIYNIETGAVAVSCGASGAIYGLMGALLVCLLFYNRHQLRKMALRFILYIALSLYSGMMDPGIDNAAHVGGFVAGAVICIGIELFTRKDRI